MTESSGTTAIDQEIEEATETNVVPGWQNRFSTPLRNCRVLMLAPTTFFADYGCHVRILEEATVLQELGHSVTIATYRHATMCQGWTSGARSPSPCGRGSR